MFGDSPFFRSSSERPPSRPFSAAPLCGVGPLPQADRSSALLINAPPDAPDFAAFTRENPEIRLESGQTTGRLVGLREMLETTEPVFVPLDRPGFAIYGHWLLDILPRVLTATALLGGRAIFYASREVPDFARALLEALQLPQPIAPHTPPSGHWLLPAPSRRHDYMNASSFADHVLPAFASARERFTAGASAAQRLYVSRSHWAKQRRTIHARRLINAERIEELFAAAGFRIIQPELLAVPDQIALFGSCRILAGEAGSGLHNSMFMPHEKGSVVLSLQSGRQSHFIQSSLCAACGQTPIYVVGQAASNEWGADFEIAERHVIAALERL